MIHLLHLEDNPLDHKLVCAKLSEEGFDFQIIRVDAREAFAAALDDAECDAILADYSLPQFDGLSALKMSIARRPDVPFLLISGAVGDMAAVDVMKAGATDFVLKNELQRLGPALRRALRESQERRARIEAEHALIAAKEAAEAANRAKDRFLATLSHELRTPLSPVLITLHAMESDATLPQAVRHDVSMMRRNVELESRLIDDLLDLSRITTGKLELDLQSTDVHDLVGHVLASAEHDILSKNLGVERELSAARFVVNGDATRLQQVFWNLIRNAIKFTPPGGTIRVRSAEVPEGIIEIEISDTGIGIPAEILPRIFDAFEQGDPSITRRYGGLGLGLSISKAVVDLHRGTIAAASDGADQGASFRVRLPLAMPRPQTTAPRTSRSLCEADRPRILLVEDHPDTSNMLNRLLSINGFCVHVAGSKATALAAAADQPFDLVVSDIGLPDATGYELMRELSARYGLRGIALTGYGMDEDIEQSREAGFAEHLVKPIDFARLQTLILRMLDAG